jgi:Lactate dehydrogenase and related dehydrogenases
MAVAVSLFPKVRFEAAKIELPKKITFRFLEDFSQEAVIEACKGADCLLVPAAVIEVNACLLESLQHLKLIQCPGAGYDHVDIEIAARLGIPVANVPGQNITSVAELTVGLTIALQRQIVNCDYEIKKGNFRTFRDQLLGHGVSEIGGSRVGLIGLGAIGGHTAKLLRMLGASVSYYTRNRKSEEIEAELQVQYRALEELLATSDIISLHIPVTDETRGMIGCREFGLMPKGALLVNTARGEVVNQSDLAEYLENGHLGGAALDTLYPEPPEPDHPLLNLSEAASKKILLTAHVGGLTVGAFRRMMGIAFENMQRAIRGESIKHVVNGISRTVI